VPPAVGPCRLEHRVEFAKGIHPKRDIEALRQGAYGECPLEKCPESVEDLSPENPYSPATAPTSEQCELSDW